MSAERQPSTAQLASTPLAPSGHGTASPAADETFRTMVYARSSTFGSLTIRSSSPSGSVTNFDAELAKAVICETTSSFPLRLNPVMPSSRATSRTVSSTLHHDAMYSAPMSWSTACWTIGTSETLKGNGKNASTGKKLPTTSGTIALIAHFTAVAPPPFECTNTA